MWCIHMDSQASQLKKKKQKLFLDKTHFWAVPSRASLLSITVAHRRGKGGAASAFSSSGTWDPFQLLQTAFKLWYCRCCLGHKASIPHNNTWWGHIYSNRTVMHSYIMNHLLIALRKALCLGNNWVTPLGICWHSTYWWGIMPLSTDDKSKHTEICKVLLDVIYLDG